MARTLANLVLLLAVAAVAAQEPKPDKTLRFTDIKGATHHPLDVKDAKAAVLVFITTDCPIANYYTSEINAIVKDHADKTIRFYVVHVDPDLTTAAAGKHAATYQLAAPVLIDAKHQLVAATGATITPEAVVLVPDGKIAYRGRIDDTYVELGKRRVAPNRRDLREALAAVLAGQPVKETRTKAIGCPIAELRR
jgi:hypothetical protein